MHARLLFGDATLVDEHLHVRVVLGDLDELVATQQIRPRVADMHHGELRAGEENAGQRGAHALERRVGVDRVSQILVGRVDRAPQRIDQRVAGNVFVELCHRRDREVAGHVAGGHATHAVGDGEQPRTGIYRVLVAFPDQPAITAGGITQGKSHGRNSSEVRPMRIGTPRGTGVGPLTRVRSR